MTRSSSFPCAGFRAAPVAVQHRGPALRTSNDVTSSAFNILTPKPENRVYQTSHVSISSDLCRCRAANGRIVI